MNLNLIFNAIAAQMVKLLLLVGFSLIMANPAFALRCQSADNGTYSDIEPIGSIAVPQSVPDGTVIWRSENRTMDITCWKDQGGPAENVYLYPNPARVTLGPGLQYGIVLNGNTVDMTQYQIALPIVIPACTYGSDTCKSTYPVNFSFSYNVFIIKKGTVSGNYSGSDSFGVFQLDGINGLNVDGSFRYSNTGLTSIRFIPCAASVTITPNNIVFDTVTAYGAVVGQAAAPAKDFSATVTKDCSAPFTLTAQYTSPSPLIGTNGLDMGNGLKLAVMNNTSGQFVDFTNTTPFADMTSAMSVTVPFTTNLTYLNTTPTTGNYSTSMTITVYYN